MMNTYQKKAILKAQRTAGGRIVCNRLYILGILISTVLFFHPLLTNAQDSIPQLPQGSSNRNIQLLKQSFEHEVADAGHATALLQTSKDLHYLPGQVVALSQLAVIYDGQRPEESAKSLQEAQQLAGQIRDLTEAAWAMGQLGKLRQHNSSQSTELKKGLADVFRSLGLAMQHSTINVHQKHPAKTDSDGIDAYMNGVDLSDLKQVKMMTQRLKSGLAGRSFTPDWQFTDHWLDSLIGKGNTTQKATRRLMAQKASRDSTRALSNAFAKKGNFAEAYRYFLDYTAYKDSLTAEVSGRRVAALEYNQQLLKKEAQIKLLTKDRQLKEQAASRQLFYMFALFGCIAALTAILLILNRNNRVKKRANAQLNAQKDELQTTLTELKSAQAQLVHSEKMASLGELTAGIAHEIQNPLNFVNNFSEVSSELVHELMENQRLPELDREMDMELLNDVDLNLQKISLHGMRASAIIKRMLEHSRTGSGAKEQTDLDALIEEYLKLSYHGMRARDKTFEVKIVTDLKSGPETITLVPQEIGRVLLNIINNAFYAVQQRQKTDQNGFEPTVTVTSSRDRGQVIIKIKDNGPGMPEQVRQKVFQPFFTTKPTGEGTGLGLSLSYDIITKGHGGKLSVASEVNSYTEFTVVLPG
jgi:signal transduction histidine kinase